MAAYKNHFRKAGDTLGDFIRRSRRSAKIARCARCSDCDFRRSPRSAYKIADIWPACQISAIKFAGICQVCPFPRFSTLIAANCQLRQSIRLGNFITWTMLKFHIAAIGEKNRQVCPHQSVAKIACDFRWRSNSPRSAYKIARCVAGLSGQLHLRSPFSRSEGVRLRELPLYLRKWFFCPWEDPCPLKLVAAGR